MSNNTSSSNVTDSASLQSPVPYLFAAVASFVLFISFSFVILACFHWKLCADSEELSIGPASDQGAEESYEIQLEDTEEKVMVIMAGDEKPTHLGKPMSCADTTLNTVARV
jgi:hypothetical protein